jgi:hypothetical protein
MIFKDEAAILGCRWRALRAEDEIEDIAAQTAVALAREKEVPEDVIDALDGLMRHFDNRGHAIIRIVRYIDSLVDEREPRRTA